MNKLEEWVNEHNGTWEKTLVFGKTGFRFNLPNTNRTWELELQPQLRLTQGVTICCQPDFMLRCADDESILPVAIFTDGFEFHVETNRLGDDMAKRRAILVSGRYHIWNLTWDDLSATSLEEFLVVPNQIAAKVEIFTTTAITKGLTMPMGRLAIGNAWQQFTGFIQRPEASGWRRLAEFTAAFPLEVLAASRVHAESTLRNALNHWRNGQDFIVPPSIDSGEWVCYDRTSGGTDVIALSTIADCLANRRDQVRVTARLGDSETERSASQTYRPRWRKFLACLNLLQFCGAFTFFTTSEVEAGTAPDVLPDPSVVAAFGEWAEIRAEVIPSLQYVVDELAVAGVPTPQAAYEDEAIDDTAVAELAWVMRSPRIAVLAGDQALLVSAWEANGWTVVTVNELQAKGTAFLIELVGTETRGNS